MRSRRSARMLLPVLAVLIALAACGRAPAPQTGSGDAPNTPGSTAGSGAGSDTLVLAAPPDLELPALDGVEVRHTDQPAAALARGEADAAVIDGEPPPVYAAFPLSAREYVVMQGWLDEPMALTLDEAWALLPTLGPPGEPSRGALAAGRLADLHPGWRAVPVDGVVPTPQTVRSGEYPLADRRYVAYRPEEADRVAPLRKALEAGTDSSAGGSGEGGPGGSSASSVEVGPDSSSASSVEVGPDSSPAGSGEGGPGGSAASSVEVGPGGSAASSAEVGPGSSASSAEVGPGISTGETGDWIKLSVAGDLMLARGVARAMREHGTLYPILKVKDHLAAADLAFANLESPIGVKGSPLPGKQIWFRAAPEAIEVLKAAGLDGVTVANNHIMDYDEENFLETLEILAEAGIPWTGGGRNLAEARRPLVLEAEGVRIAFLGYSEFADLFFDWDYPRSFAATDDRPGVPAIREDWLAQDIRAAREVADVVAVALHWGVEFTNYPTEEQRRLARYMVDQGADLVLGYHPHAIQGFEIYKGKVIAYSLGNFIMDRQDTDLARESMILDFLIGPDGVKQVEVHPVWIAAEQPCLLEGEEAARLRAKMQEISGW